MLVHREALLKQFVEGLKRTPPRASLGILQARFFVGAKCAVKTDLPTALEILVDDIGEDEEHDWSLADSIEVEVV